MIACFPLDSGVDNLSVEPAVNAQGRDLLANLGYCII
jgi:hypothetical protein